MSSSPGADAMQQDATAPRRPRWRFRLLLVLACLLIVASIVLSIWNPLAPSTRVGRLLAELEEVYRYQQPPGPPTFLEDLQEFLFGGARSKDPELRDVYDIQMDLIAMGPAAVPELIKALPRQSEPVREDIAIVLGQIGDPAARELLIETLRKDAGVDVRKAAAAALTEMPGPGVREVLIEALEQDADDSVRARAVYCISNFSSDRITTLLLETLKGATSADVRAAAATVLRQRHSAEVVSALIAALDDSADEVRVSAARALGHLADPIALPRLIRMMKTDEQCAAFAARALGSIRDRRATPALITDCLHLSPGRWVS